MQLPQPCNQSIARGGALWLIGGALALGAKGPWIEICTGQKNYYATHVVHLGNERYSCLLHSTQVNEMGTGLGWEVNRLVVSGLLVVWLALK